MQVPRRLLGRLILAVGEVHIKFHGFRISRARGARRERYRELAEHEAGENDCLHVEHRAQCVLIPSLVDSATRILHATCASPASERHAHPLWIGRGGHAGWSRRKGVVS